MQVMSIMAIFMNLRNLLHILTQIYKLSSLYYGPDFSPWLSNFFSKLLPMWETGQLMSNTCREEECFICIFFFFSNHNYVILILLPSVIGFDRNHSAKRHYNYREERCVLAVKCAITVSLLSPPSALFPCSFCSIYYLTLIYLIYIKIWMPGCFNPFQIHIFLKPWFANVFSKAIKITWT